MIKHLVELIVCRIQKPAVSSLILCVRAPPCALTAVKMSHGAVILFSNFIVRRFLVSDAWSDLVYI